MFEFVNNLVLSNIDRFETMFTFLLIVVVGSPFISFNGGIPRIGKKIINKEKSLIVLLSVTFLTLYIIGPLVGVLAHTYILKYVDYTLSTLFILGSLALWEWSKKMRWHYNYYYTPAFVFGIILFLIEYL